MQPCSYCDAICQPTREHVIPDWYIQKSGELETFSARAPLTHLRGAMLVKDVCATCNNGVLSELDSYGKVLYNKHLALPVYANESLALEYDGDRLVRWLLKISYNSARAQNADVGVLRQYRQAILGKVPIPDCVRCWVHLVGATRWNKAAGTARPARREERGQPGVREADWFRVCQLRLRDLPALFLVQRAVIIDSFCFSLLIGNLDETWPNADHAKWIDLFTKAYPCAKPVQLGLRNETLRAEGEHVAASMLPLAYQYPSRFLPEKNPEIVSALKGELKVVVLVITENLIAEENITPIAEALQEMVSTRENALAFRQRVSLAVDGYDSDPRELWEVPCVKDFCRRLFSACPFVMLLAHPEGVLLKLLAACWMYEEGGTPAAEACRLSDFLDRGFRGLNRLNHTVALSEEIIRDISTAVPAALTGGSPKVA